MSRIDESTGGPVGGGEHDRSGGEHRQDSAAARLGADTMPPADVTEPEVTEPEVTEPGVTEPEVTEPGVTEPGVEADVVEERPSQERPHADQERPEPLIPADRSADYRARWDVVKGQFVDDPRSAAQGANTMVGEILDELEELFRRQRSELEQGLNDERTSTEDLRLALRRYRSFFDRLITF